MRRRFERLLESVDRLTLRERLMVLAAVLVVIAGAWEALLAAPLEARERVAAAKVQSLKQRMEQLNRSVELTALGISDGMPGSLQRIEALEQRIAQGAEAVRVFTSDLVDPAEMRFVLEDLIRKESGLELVSMSNMEERPLLDSEDAADETGDAGQPKLYRHTLVVVLEGRYLDCLRYLEAVERLPWQLYWTRLELESGEYPTNRIAIELSTLSLDEEWIGV